LRGQLLICMQVVVSSGLHITGSTAPMTTSATPVYYTCFQTSFHVVHLDSHILTAHADTS